MTDTETSDPAASVSRAGDPPSRRLEIVVGVDLSEQGQAALAWAAEHAVATGARLRAVHVLEWPTGLSAAGFPRPADFLDIIADELEPSYRETVAQLFAAVSPRPDWRLQFASGDAGQILVHFSRRAALLVVGTREHTGVRRIMNGSVSHYCLRHAGCPVVAVPLETPVATSEEEGSPPAVHAEQPEPDPTSDPKAEAAPAAPVVVGVDGSAEAVAAARYGVAAADRLQTEVVLVHAFPVPSGYAEGVLGLSAARASAEAVLEAVAAQLVVPSGVSVRTVAEPGGAVEVLCQFGRDATLLVVGRDDLAWHQRIFPGAVASGVAARMPSPLVVVPRGWRPRHVAGAPPIVVALDGESRSESTMQLAVREARLRSAPIVVLHAEPLGVSRRQREAAEYAVAIMLSRLKHKHPDIGFKAVQLSGDTDANLVRWSRSAQVLIVGRPHQGGWRSWPRSVARSVMRRTRCPLLIAPPERAATAGRPQPGVDAEAPLTGAPSTTADQPARPMVGRTVSVRPPSAGRSR